VKKNFRASEAPIHPQLWPMLWCNSCGLVWRRDRHMLPRFAAKCSRLVTRLILHRQRLHSELAPEAEDPASDCDGAEESATVNVVACELIVAMERLLLIILARSISI
jgi:hypothetical protein